MNYRKNIYRLGLMIGLVFLGCRAYAQELEKASIQDRYKNGEKIHILVVPGHDNQFPGAKYKTNYEEDMNLALAEQVADYLRKDLQIEVVVTRNVNGYMSSLYEYFQTQTLKINDFIKSHSLAMKKEIKAGSIIVPKQVPHATASKVPMYRLYALNKWANENKYDLIIHVHFDDEGDRVRDVAGKFSGYSVYVPDSNLLQADISKSFGLAIAKRLNRDFNRSTQPYEHAHADSNGIIPDMKLIAMGANKTTAIPRVLIEYAYIYEPGVDPKHFPMTSDVMAAATAYGVEDFLKQDSGK